MKLKRTLTTKKIIIPIIVLVVGLASGATYVMHKRAIDQKKADTAAKPKDPGPNFINYGPATEQEKQDAEAHKDEVVEQTQIENQAANNPTKGKKSVKPVITNIDTINNQVTITVYISGIFEEGGTCTLTATKASEKRSYTSQAFANATTTDCTPFRLNPSDFSAGEWSFKIDYSSAAATGTSDIKTYRVH